MATKATALAKIEEAKQEINNIEEKPIEEQVLDLNNKIDYLQKLIIAGIVIASIGMIGIFIFLTIIYVIL